MANGHGGPRTPTNPAPVSGPGRLSKRTDGGPAQKLMVGTDGNYGDRTATLNQERAAPMSQRDAVTPTDVPAGAGGPPGAPAPSGPFGGGTGRPGEPITHGTPIGPGAGPEVLGTAAAKPAGYLTTLLQQLAPADDTGTLARLLVIAEQRGV